MQRGGGNRDDLFGDPFFGDHWSLVSNFFGGRNPFDDHFFNPLSMFGLSLFSGAPNQAPVSGSIPRSSGPVIQEILSDESDGEGGKEEKKDNPRKHLRSGREVHVDDQAEADIRREQRMDTTIGNAAHRVSRGIYDKVHSFTRKLNSDGKVDSMQTLHNLEEAHNVLFSLDALDGFKKAWERNAQKHLPGLNGAHNVLFSLDELDGFEKAWERNAQMNLPGWNEGFNTQGNVGKFLSGNTLSILY
ncbi:hypothetical protein GIB67_022250 [Kingdonia uniflora]|uniref:Uncharacterized protein n=1 Tax=Kingdonia uniflora TaxID=39325 RepID=A0A7J7M7A8_9MAGN|nr:hypothetical protein GIB67_022250 [Kingdonia uniflora]